MYKKVPFLGAFFKRGADMFLDEMLKPLFENEKYIVCPTFSDDHLFDVTYVLFRDSRQKAVIIEYNRKNKNLHTLDVEFIDTHFIDSKELFHLTELWARKHSPERLKIATGTIQLNSFHNLQHLPELLPSLGLKYLELSVRSYNVLHREKYYTLKEVLVLTEERLRTFHSLGDRNVYEILTKIDEFKSKE